jgi:flavin-dependent dehydrogenase
MAEEATDVVVVGGGPAGSAAACVLAQAGLAVTLLERAPGARYHVGESLLPLCFPVLERMGALEAIRAAAFQEKNSVQFIRPDGRPSQPFYFASHLKTEAATTWQVDRQRFDEILLATAEAAGATVVRGWEAHSLLEEHETVCGVMARDAHGEDHRLRAKWTLDASGRDGLSMRERRWRVSEPALDRVALWGYFEGAGRGQGDDEGATTIASLPGGGWIWFLPMADDLTSVGVVAKLDEYAGDLQHRREAFDKAVATQPWVAERLEGAKIHDDLHVTRNYSYFGQHAGKAGLLLCGDAFAFLDPVFSSGIYIALRSGAAAADGVIAASRGERTAQQTVEDYTGWLTGQIEPMRRLIYAFYDPEFSIGQLIRDRPELRGDLTDILVGNVDRDFAALMGALEERTAAPQSLAAQVGRGEL